MIFDTLSENLRLDIEARKIINTFSAMVRYQNRHKTKLDNRHFAVVFRASRGGSPDIRLWGLVHFWRENEENGFKPETLSGIKHAKRRDKIFDES